MYESINDLNNMARYYTATNQTQAEQAISAHQYIIGSVDAYGQFTIASTPAIHTNIGTADVEARRLASCTPGKTFVILQLSTGYRTGGITKF